MTTFAEKVEVLARGLEAGEIAYALGGALALAYCTLEPRATGDIDVNVFVSPTDADVVFSALPEGVRVEEADRARVAREGQVRLWWDDTPLDLFFQYHDFHREVSGRVRDVPFGGVRVRVLDCTDLTVFKAIFGRSRDWADIEAMTDAATIDVQRALTWTGDLLGPDSDTHHRLAQALTPHREPDEAERYRRAFGNPSDDASG